MVNFLVVVFLEVDVAIVVDAVVNLGVVTKGKQRIEIGFLEKICFLPCYIPVCIIT